MTSDRAYHHGDLRRAVLTAALDTIAADGPDALSLRSLARRAGVSHSAPAHHFKDRTGLLTAVAAEGYALLADALTEAPDLRERGVAYVRFAIGHPAHFQVMFRPELHHADDPALLAGKARATDALRAGISGLPETARGDDERLAGIAAWSLAHGFATLLLSGSLDEPVGGRDPGDVFRALAASTFARGAGQDAARDAHQAPGHGQDGG
ncbi:TetR/AcrR family transcriptional regulator [Streptomyces sp. NPDC005899]|uniref:TetR/AcrR family transcriptional regulator n=1 Tax=Streptomyces sp. NPDC005899 TaxID=3155716 RepID=UPI0033DA06D0